MSQGATSYRLVEMKIRPGRTTIGLFSSVVLPAANSRRMRKARIGGVTTGRQRYSIISDGLPTQLPDIDPDETREWVDSFDSVTRTRGRGRAREQQVGVPGMAEDHTAARAAVEQGRRGNACQRACHRHRAGTVHRRTEGRGASTRNAWTLRPNDGDEQPPSARGVPTALSEPDAGSEEDGGRRPRGTFPPPSPLRLIR